jgi:hypothetical protein
MLLTLSQMFLIVMAMMKLLLQTFMKTNLYMMNMKMICDKLLHQHTWDSIIVILFMTIMKQSFRNAMKKYECQTKHEEFFAPELDKYVLIVDSIINHDQYRSYMSIIRITKVLSSMIFFLLKLMKRLKYLWKLQKHVIFMSCFKEVKMIIVSLMGKKLQRNSLIF